jgi:hypothetical protein
LCNQTYGNAPFAVSATASSGLPVSFTILSGPATIISNTVTIQGVGTVTIQASQAGNSSWNPAPNLSQSFAVSAKTITASITASNKIYDGGAAAAIASRALAGVVGGDIVNLIGGTASFADKNVGAGKTVIATGLSLGGASATNYLLASTSATTAADITPVTLRVQADDQTRAYGTTNPVLTVSYLGFVNSEGTNVLSGAPSVSTTATTNSLAGTYPITVSAGTLSAANYSFSFLSGQLTVTAPAVVLPGNLTGIQVTSGTVALSFVGSPGTTYHIQRTAGIQDAGTVWSDIGSATTDAAGQGTFTDNNPLSGQGFYRTSSQ